MGLIEDIKSSLRAHKRAQQYKGKEYPSSIEESRCALQSLFKEKSICEDFTRALVSGIHFQEALAFVCSCEEEFNFVYYDTSSLWVAHRIRPELSYDIDNLSEIARYALEIARLSRYTVISELEPKVEQLIVYGDSNHEEFAEALGIDISKNSGLMERINYNLIKKSQSARLDEQLSSQTDYQESHTNIGTSNLVKSATKQKLRMIAHERIHEMHPKYSEFSINSPEANAVYDALNKVLTEQPEDTQLVIDTATRMAEVPVQTTDEAIEVVGPDGISLKIEGKIRDREFDKLGEIAGDFLYASRSAATPGKPKRKYTDKLQQVVESGRHNTMGQRIQAVRSLSPELLNHLKKIESSSKNKFKTLARVNGINVIIAIDPLGMVVLIDSTTADKMGVKNSTISKIPQPIALESLEITDARNYFQLLQAKNPIDMLLDRIDRMEVPKSIFELYIGIITQIQSICDSEVRFGSLDDVNGEVQKVIYTAYPGIGPEIAWRIASAYKEPLYLASRNTAHWGS